MPLVIVESCLVIMALTRNFICRTQSRSPTKVSTPIHWPISSSKSHCSVSPTSSTSWDQLSSPSGDEVKEDFISYWEDVRFIAISGKRKCGKDYVATFLHNEIQERLGQTAAIIHISEPIKRAFAEEYHLELQELMSSSAYKEHFRRHMVRWGEALRRKDTTIFCRKALEYLIQDSPFKPAFVIVADCRRPTDLEYFSSLNKDTPLLHLRILASPVTRGARGWIYNSGIDDAETECALDRTPFDVLVINESQRTLTLSMAVVRRALSDNPPRKMMTI
ncbi:putative phosphomevalonate kinase [Echinococcus granulosus]|uniref:Phosphomevalonate kinase n=2 Tax=Echinococcus granulosus TaxID=6210 RepID=A0A068WJ83_ECHGR|nr:putative phosphomevalonate kinase [Echinococcus granulosus]CDS20160.1 phosphomevalonate kinase [Echinococcus granulosus]